MDVYISVDMEGIAGIATVDQIVRGGHNYPRSQELMTAEANAAIAGAFDAGADTVVVNDSHGTMDNFLQDALDERARLVTGSPKAQCMAHGLDGRHAVALFVGYHAPGGCPGVLAHSFSSFFTWLRLNDEIVSEAEVNALLAAEHGVPVGLVTGDDQICALAERVFPGVVTATVKTAEGYTAADSLHPRRAQALIREAATAAVGNAPSLRPVPLPERLVVTAGFQIPTAAEYAADVPGAERVDEYTVSCEVPDLRSLMGLIGVWYSTAALAARTRLALIDRR
ncbi:M55 family metallopeptidase [Actinomadura harenae]|uniref:Aminopeptidase n=1 Tax=Actinomadura harenae TaxID=2483351 RepID=A0A3M2LNL9_9ACTN|nr:M55 family metallopeptidase [Actinomadura harenae]RMI36398.1 aminopeptidase [Actinomadura harenae]